MRPALSTTRATVNRMAVTANAAATAAVVHDGMNPWDMAAPDTNVNPRANACDAATTISDTSNGHCATHAGHVRGHFRGQKRRTANTYSLSYFV